MSAQPDIYYTKTDESAALATASLLPIIQHFAKAAGITIGVADISLAGRIIAQFPENLTSDQRQSDALAELGKLANDPKANIIKLPNISASVPQLKAAIKELQEHGYDIPDYPEDPQSENEEFIQKRYATILGSAVNPVLRQGNADRRPIPAAKAYAKNNPPSTAPWNSKSKTHVAHMQNNDFFSHEKSATVSKPGHARIEFVEKDGTTTVLNPRIPLQEGEVVDATYMNVKALRKFIKEQKQEAKDQGVLFSVHLKATMMKVSDPEMFGHIVEVFFEDVFKKHSALFEEIGVDSNNGIGDVEQKFQAERDRLVHELEEVLKKRNIHEDLSRNSEALQATEFFIENGEITVSARVPQDILTPKAVGILAHIERLDDMHAEVKTDIQAALDDGPDLMMVDAEKGITNLHKPNGMIIDASIPPIMRWGGQATGPDGRERDTKIIVPDTSYATFFKEMADFSKENGTFDPATMGSVFNIGLMAQKAEEYGSHDKTYTAKTAGTMRVIGEDGEVIHEHDLEQGDIWRMCQTKDTPIKNWIETSVNKALATRTPTVFWLDKNRAHDAQLIAKIKEHLETMDTTGFKLRIMAPQDAARFTNERVKKGLNTNAATGNVLRDYITDMYPILELGTSAKMLSIVQQMAGGAMFETGAGGTAPDLVQKTISESHLSWDSLGEFAAISASFDYLGKEQGHDKAAILGEALNRATTRLLNTEKSPSPTTGQLDNKGSHFYLAKYWAEELAAQRDNAELREYFIPLAQELVACEDQIVEELLAVEGQEADLGGYYHPDPAKMSAVMRPSATMNDVLVARVAYSLH